MGNAQPNANQPKEEGKAPQPLSRNDIIQSYEANGMLNDNFAKIKNSLKFLYKNNFVSLTFVIYLYNSLGRHKRLLHPNELEAIHHK